MQLFLGLQPTLSRLQMRVFTREACLWVRVELPVLQIQ
jgi:hypothetical protein